MLMPVAETECCTPQSASDATKPNVPHPVSAPSGYKAKGTIESRGGFEKVYTVRRDKELCTSKPDVQVGPKSKHAIVVVYDIFGFW